MMIAKTHYPTDEEEGGRPGPRNMEFILRKLTFALRSKSIRSILAQQPLPATETWSRDFTRWPVRFWCESRSFPQCRQFVQPSVRLKS